MQIIRFLLPSAVVFVNQWDRGLEGEISPAYEL